MIGRECKYSNVFSGPILICRGLDLRSKPEVKVGDQIGVELFEKVRFIDVTATSKGKGKN